MPEICRFLGISIRMYFNEHNPPHFHAVYNEWRAQIGIAELSLLEGSLPPRVLGLVLEWALEHRSELLANWHSLRNDGTCSQIPPLA
jgi:hypothetical protein